jgi:hypothetical protein
MNEVRIIELCCLYLSSEFEFEFVGPFEILITSLTFRFEI